MFTINQNEVIYILNKVRNDFLLNAAFNANKQAVCKPDYLNDIFTATDENYVDKLLGDYAQALIDNFKPEYITSLRGSLRSHRSRLKKQYTKEKATSVTISSGTQERIQALQKITPQNVTQEFIIMQALDLLESSLITNE